MKTIAALIILASSSFLIPSAQADQAGDRASNDALMQAMFPTTDPYPRNAHPGCSAFLSDPARRASCSKPYETDYNPPDPFNPYDPRNDHISSDGSGR